MTIGSRIKALRLQKDMTQEEIAEILNTTKQNIYKYENDIITNIPSDKIEKLAKYFNVSPAYLMGWIPEGVDETTWIINHVLTGEKDVKTDMRLKSIMNKLSSALGESMPFLDAPKRQKNISISIHMTKHWEDKYEPVIANILDIAECSGHSLDYLFDKSTLEEEKLIKAYRDNPQMQEAVKKLLGFE